MMGGNHHFPTVQNDTFIRAHGVYWIDMNVVDDFKPDLGDTLGLNSPSVPGVPGDLVNQKVKANYAEVKATYFAQQR